MYFISFYQEPVLFRVKIELIFISTLLKDLELLSMLNMDLIIKSCEKTNVKYLQCGQLGQIGKGVVGQNVNLVVAQVSEKISTFKKRSH